MNCVFCSETVDYENLAEHLSCIEEWANSDRSCPYCGIIVNGQQGMDSHWCEDRLSGLALAQAKIAKLN